MGQEALHSEALAMAVVANDVAAATVVAVGVQLPEGAHNIVHRELALHALDWLSAHLSKITL